MSADDIAAVVKQRGKLAAFSRETGIPKHGDLTQMDRQIVEMEDGLNRAAFQRQQIERGSRER